MKSNVTYHDFERAFVNADRFNAWTNGGLRALYEYLDENFGDDYEFDCVGIDGEYAEYGSAIEAVKDFGGFDLEDCPICWASGVTCNGDDYFCGSCDEVVTEEMEAATLEWLKENHTTIEFDGGVIIGE